MKKSYQNLLGLTAVICLILLYSIPVFCLNLDPKNQAAAKATGAWSPGRKITINKASVKGYRFKEYTYKVKTVGTWVTEDIWAPEITAKGVTKICTGRWVPAGDGGGGGTPPPDLYCTGINAMDFPNQIIFVKPKEDKYIIAGGSVLLEVSVKRGDNTFPGCKIDWSINPTGSYFSKSGGTGYTQVVSSSSEPKTPAGTFCTVKATIKDTTISDTSKKITVFGVEIDQPSEFPAYVNVGQNLQLGSKVTPSAATGGTYSWTKVSGPGNVTFSPSAATEDPAFSTSASGTYKVKVEYTKDDSASTSSPSGRIISLEQLIEGTLDYSVLRTAMNPDEKWSWNWKDGDSADNVFLSGIKWTKDDDLGSFETYDKIANQINAEFIPTYEGTNIPTGVANVVLAAAGIQTEANGLGGDINGKHFNEASGYSGGCQTLYTGAINGNFTADKLNLFGPQLLIGNPESVPSGTHVDIYRSWSDPLSMFGAEFHLTTEGELSIYITIRFGGTGKVTYHTIKGVTHTKWKEKIPELLGWI